MHGPTCQYVEYAGGAVIFPGHEAAPKNVSLESVAKILVVGADFGCEKSIRLPSEDRTVRDEIFGFQIILGAQQVWFDGLQFFDGGLNPFGRLALLSPPPSEVGETLFDVLHFL